MPARYTPERFWSKIDKTSAAPCWLWTGKRHIITGYGQVRYQRVMRPAHRVALELLGIVVPSGLECDHTCRIRHCCNPAHIDFVTHAENVRRAFDRRTHCAQGHALIPENIKVEVRSSGIVRRCLTCRRQNQVARNATRRRLRLQNTKDFASI